MKKGEMLSKIIVIATNAHAGQFDKAGLPYIMHPMTVMYLLNSDDEELNCGAIGHDLFEDTDVTAADLREEDISERVIDMIYGVTKMPGESYEEYKAKVKAHPDRIKIKKADLRHNSDLRRLKGVSEKDCARTVKYLLFYDELNEAEKEMK